MSSEIKQQVLYFNCSDPVSRQNNVNDLNNLIAKGWTVDEIVHGHHESMSYMYAIVSKKEQKPSAGIQ